MRQRLAGMSTTRFSLPCCAALAFVPLLASSALADCDADLAKARAIADTIKVDFDPGKHPRAGEPIRIVWQNLPSERPATPVYLVVTVPAEVRFAGTGFMALTAGANGPWGLAHGIEGARAFVPFYRPVDRNVERGEISVLPLRVGKQTFGWAVATAGACGERVFGKTERIVDVAAGPPVIVVQDRYASASPLKRIRSKNGVYDLLVFEDRYEVDEVATGAKLVERYVTNRSQTDFGWLRSPTVQKDPSASAVC
jgi:hypothetical protein